MSARVRKSYPFMKLIVKAAKVSLLLARRLLGQANTERLMCMTEVTVNVLRGGIKISSRIQTILRKLSKVRKPEQHGGILPETVPPPRTKLPRRKSSWEVLGE